MAEVGTAFVSVLPDAKGFGSTLGKQVDGDLSGSGKSIGSKFGSAIKVGAVAALGGAALLGGFIKGALGEAREAQKVGALTNAVIKSTGGVANVTAKDVDKLSTAISLKTGVDDEAIAAGQNMLLTFGNVRNELGKGNDIFTQATVAATDMAAAFGGDAVSNSKMLGKALNDPTKGVSALTRVGVSFTQGQKDQIKALQESGNIMGAQKIILGELSKQTAGAAESQATAGDKLTATWNNFKEQVGAALLPTFDRILNGLNSVVQYLMANFSPALAAVKTFIAPVVASVRQMFATFQGGGGSTAVFDTLREVGSSLAANFLPVLKTMAETFRNVVLPAVLSLGQYLATSLMPIFSKVASLVTTNVIPIIASLAKFFYGTLYPAVIAIVVAVLTRLKPVFDQLVATFQNSVLPAVEKLLVKFREWQPTIQKVIMVVVKVIGFILKLAATILAKVLPAVIRFAGFLIGALVNALIAIVTGIGKVIGFLGKVGGAFGKALGFVTKFQSGVANMVGNVVRFIGQLPGKILNLAKDMLRAGKGLMDGLLKGLSSVGGFAGDLASAVGNAIKGVINSMIGNLNGALPNSLGAGPLKVDLPDNPIPMLAKGGIVSSATLAMIGEGREREAVMPLSKLSAMLDRERAVATAGGGRRLFTITNWQTGAGYFEDIAEGVYMGYASLEAERGRAG